MPLERELCNSNEHHQHLEEQQQLIQLQVLWGRLPCLELLYFSAFPAKGSSGLSGLHLQRNGKTILRGT